jgi:hypothetical protein
MSRKCSRCGCYLSGYSIGRGWTMCHACEPTIKAYEPGGCKTHGYTQWDHGRRECVVCRKEVARLRMQRHRAKKNLNEQKGQ